MGDKNFYRWFIFKDKSSSRGFIAVRKADTCYGNTVYQYYIRQLTTVMFILFGFFFDNVQTAQHTDTVSELLLAQGDDGKPSGLAKLGGGGSTGNREIIGVC